MLSQVRFNQKIYPAPLPRAKGAMNATPLTQLKPRFSPTGRPSANDFLFSHPFREPSPLFSSHFSNRVSRCSFFKRKLGSEFKPGYRACLIQTGHKLSLNLILGPDLVTKNNVFVSSLTPAAGVPARKRSRGGPPTLPTKNFAFKPASACAAAVELQS